MLTAQTIAIITAIGGFVVPPIASLIKRTTWATQWKQLLAGALSLAVAAVGIAVTAPADFALPLLTLGSLIYVGSQIVYGAYFKQSQLDTVLTNFGSKQKVTPPTAVTE
jgi:hypothetical protein